VRSLRISLFDTPPFFPGRSGTSLRIGLGNGGFFNAISLLFLQPLLRSSCSLVFCAPFRVARTTLRADRWCVFSYTRIRSLFWSFPPTPAAKTHRPRLLAVFGERSPPHLHKSIFLYLFALVPRHRIAFYFSYYFFYLLRTPLFLIPLTGGFFTPYQRSPPLICLDIFTSLL